MTSFDFETKTFGKWILAGEHAVLRGWPALVFPLKSVYFSLKFQAKQNGLAIEGNKQLRHICDGFLTYAQSTLNLTLPDGILYLENHIPERSGLGASAAFCLAFAQWFVFLGLVHEKDILAVAQKLEHFFHGQSSGLDIAGSAAAGPIIYRDGVAQPLDITFKPAFVLIHTGIFAPTDQCIKRTSNGGAQRFDIDEQMGTAVEMAIDAISTQDINALAAAIKMASDCFVTWGLISPAMQQQMSEYYQRGALAIKPTGSGLGGFLLTLWPSISYARNTLSNKHAHQYICIE